MREDVDIGDDGTLDGRYLYTYDSLNRLLAVEEIAVASQQPVNWERYRYDDDGRLVQQDVYMNGAWHDSWTYSYGQLGRLTEWRYSSARYDSRRYRYVYSRGCSYPLVTPEPCLHPVTCPLYAFMPYR